MVGRAEPQCYPLKLISKRAFSCRAYDLEALMEGSIMFRSKFVVEISRILLVERLTLNMHMLSAASTRLPRHGPLWQEDWGLCRSLKPFESQADLP
jgi:hypothetical protein